MRLAEVKKMERSQIAYTLLLCRILIQNFIIESVSLTHFHNQHGNRVTDISFNLVKKNGYSYLERIRLYDDDYIWFLSALALDFPKLKVIDKTKEKPYES